VERVFPVGVWLGLVLCLVLTNPRVCLAGEFGGVALGTSVDQALVGRHVEQMRVEGNTREYQSRYRGRIASYSVEGVDLWFFQKDRLVGGRRTIQVRLRGPADARFFWDVYSHLRRWLRRNYTRKMAHDEKGYESDWPSIPETVLSGTKHWFVAGTNRDGDRAVLKLFVPDGALSRLGGESLRVEVEVLGPETELFGGGGGGGVEATEEPGGCPGGFASVVQETLWVLDQAGVYNQEVRDRITASALQRHKCAISE